MSQNREARRELRSRKGTVSNQDNEKEQAGKRTPPQVQRKKEFQTSVDPDHLQPSQGEAQVPRTDGWKGEQIDKKKPYGFVIQQLPSDTSDSDYKPTGSGSSTEESSQLPSPEMEEDVPHKKKQFYSARLPDESSDAEMKVGTLTLLSLWGLLFLIAVLVVAILLIILIAGKQEGPHFDKLGHYSENLKKLRESFPNQSERLWKTVQARSRKHLSSDNPNRPLVFMIVSQPSTATTSSCFAKKLADTLSSRGHMFFDGRSFQSYSGKVAKLELDTKMKDTLQEPNSKAILIDYLELLPPKSPFLFYSYCDQYDSPFTSAVIIFVTHMKQSLKAGHSFLDAEIALDEFLREDVWSQPPYDDNAVTALISRISDTVLVLDPKTKIDCL